MESKNNTLVYILILIIVLLVGYIGYDKLVLSSKTNQNVVENDSLNNENKVENNSTHSYDSNYIENDSNYSYESIYKKEEESSHNLYDSIYDNIYGLYAFEGEAPHYYKLSLYKDGKFHFRFINGSAIGYYTIEDNKVILHYLLTMGTGVSNPNTNLKEEAIIINSDNTLNRNDITLSKNSEEFKDDSIENFNYTFNSFKMTCEEQKRYMCD